MANRRFLLKATVGLAGWSMLPPLASSFADDARQALKTSNLVYLTPIRSDGHPSRCRAEVWFVQDGGDIIVVSQRHSWRAEAILKGLVYTKMWVGDLGVWTRTKGRYKELPVVEAEGRMEADASVQERVLQAYKEKYSTSWLFWGRRFRNGLKEGSRVMLRYRPI